MSINDTDARFEKGRAASTIQCQDCGAAVLVGKRAHRKKVCSACRLERKRASDRRYAKANAEAARKRARDWYSANPDRVREQRARYRDAGKTAEWDKAKYCKNPEAAKQRARRWYAENRESVLAKSKTPEGRAAARQRENKKRQCPHYKMHSAVSGHIRNAIRDKGGRQVFDLLPYSREELIAHIERQFVKGMTWDNYGRHGWHIDHIVPRSAFLYQSAADPDFQACWALSNLRPMWARANIQKHDSREYLL